MPELRRALARTTATVVLNLNLDIGSDETLGFRAVDHLRSFAAHAPDLRLDVVLADPSVVEQTGDLTEAAAALGAELVVQPIAARQTPGQHDPLRLAAAYRDLLNR